VVFWALTWTALFESTTLLDPARAIVAEDTAVALGTVCAVLAGMMLANAPRWLIFVLS
jgi:hypothetical protein